MKDGTQKKEYRIYFVGEKFVYLLSEEWGTGGKNEHNLEVECTNKSKKTKLHNKIINFAKGVLKTIPKPKINNIILKHLLIRIDMTFDNDDKLIVSEIEFVPSLMVELVNYNHEFKEINIHEILADEIIEISKYYLQHKKKSNHTNTFSKLIIISIISITIIIIIYYIYYRINSNLI